MSAGIAPAKLGSLTSRMKQWQKMGFPEGTRGVGKGAKAEYGAAQVFQLMLMMKFLRLGITPERAKSIIEDGWNAFCHGIVHALISQANADGERHYFLVQLDALSELTMPDSDHMPVFVDVVTKSEIASAWTELDGDPEGEKERDFYSSFVVKNRLSSAIVMEVDTLIYWVWACLEKMEVSPSVFAEEINGWHTAQRECEHLSQKDEREFYRFSNRSAVEHDVADIDITALSREALSLIPDKYRGDD